MKTNLLRLAAVLTVLTVAVAFIVGFARHTENARHNRVAIREFSTESAKINEEAQKDDSVEGSAAKAMQIQTAMGQAASKLNGDPAKAFKAGEQLMAAMRFQIAAYEKSYSAFLSKGGLDPSTLTSDEVSRERLVLLKAFEAANKSYMDFLKGAESRFRAELAKEGFPPSQVEETVRGFRETANIDTQLAIRDTDAELCAAMETYLLLLKGERGKWKVNQAGKIVFENDRAADVLSDCLKQMNEVAKRQAEFQTKILRDREWAHGPAKQSIFETEEQRLHQDIDIHQQP